MEAVVRVAHLSEDRSEQFLITNGPFIRSLLR